MRVFHLVLLAWLLVSAAPSLAQRLSVAPFSGPGGPPVRNQLIAGLCDTADCVAPAKSTTANKPDWKKAKRESISFFITGAITKKGRATTLRLQVFDQPGKAKLSKTYPVENGELSQKNLTAAIAAMQQVLRPASPGQKVTEVEQPQPQAAAQPTATSVTEQAATQIKPPAERPASKPQRRHLFIAAELGADALLRAYSYAGVTTGNLRKYDSFFALPQAHLELYPLALTTSGALAGLGVEGGISLATWLKSSRQGTNESFPTSTMRVDAGLIWRLMPLAHFDLAVYPVVGIRLHRFTVGALADGTRLDGLPALSYFGLRAGVGLEVPVAKGALVFFARFVAMPIFSSGEVISASYFKAGSNFGLEGQAGMGLRLITHLQLRLAFDFTRYHLTFKTSPGDPYIATRATDQYLGGTGSLRFEY